MVTQKNIDLDTENEDDSFLARQPRALSPERHPEIPLAVPVLAGQGVHAGHEGHDDFTS